MITFVFREVPVMKGCPADVSRCGTLLVTRRFFLPLERLESKATLLSEDCTTIFFSLQYAPTGFLL